MVSERNGVLRIFGLSNDGAKKWAPVFAMSCAGASPLTWAAWCPSNPRRIAAVAGGRWSVWTSNETAPDAYSLKDVAVESTSHRRTTRDSSVVDDGTFTSFRWSREDPTVILANNGEQIQFFHINTRVGSSAEDEKFVLRPLHDSSEGNMAAASWHGNKALCVVAVGSRLLAARNR